MEDNVRKRRGPGGSRAAREEGPQNPDMGEEWGLGMRVGGWL